MSSVPLTASIASGPKKPDVSVISQVPRQPARLRWLPPVHLVVRGHDADDPLCPVPEIEHERDVERDEVAEPGRIEPPRRVREADVAHGARHVGPPRVDGPVGEPEVGRQVAEQVEGQRRRPQELRPQSLVIEALVRFDDGRASLGRLVCGGGEEGRAGVAGVLEREATPGRTGRLRLSRGTIGCEPIGCPFASRHCAWW